MTLEFVSTLGKLHLRHGNHANLAQKRIKYWREFIRSHYHLNPLYLDLGFIDELTRKSGKSKQLIASLVDRSNKVLAGNSVNEVELLTLDKELNQFYDIGKLKL